MIADLKKIVDTDGYPLIDMKDYWIVNNHKDEYIFDDVSAINEYLAAHGAYYSDNQNLVSAEMELLQNFDVSRGRWSENEKKFGNMPWNEHDDLKNSLAQEKLEETNYGK